MTSWLPTVFSLGSVCVGSLLTIVGQSLSDRRARLKDVEGRKEEFRIKNFEMHRTALLKMQEIVIAFSQRVLTEKTRRNVEEYPVFDKQPINDAARDLMECMASINSLTAKLSEMPKPLSVEDKERIEQMALGVVEYTKKVNAGARSMTGLTELIKARNPFYDDFMDFMTSLRLQLYRCGSNRVINAGEVYIRAIGAWNDEVTSENIEGHTEELNDKLYDLNKSISNALYHGPYWKGDK